MGRQRDFCPVGAQGDRFPLPPNPGGLEADVQLQADPWISPSVLSHDDDPGAKGMPSERPGNFRKLEGISPPPLESRGQTQAKLANV